MKKPIFERMRNFFSINWNLLKLRVRTASSILFNYKKRWVFFSMDEKQYMNFLKGKESDVNIHHHRMTTADTVEICNKISDRKEKFEEPKERLMYDFFIKKEHLN